MIETIHLRPETDTLLVVMDDGEAILYEIQAFGESGICLDEGDAERILAGHSFLTIFSGGAQLAQDLAEAETASAVAAADTIASMNASPGGKE